MDGHIYMKIEDQGVGVEGVGMGVVWGLSEGGVQDQK